MIHERLGAIAARVEADRLHFASGNAIQLDDSKDREYLLALALEQQAAIEGVCDVLSHAAAFGESPESGDVLAAIRAAITTNHQETK